VRLARARAEAPVASGHGPYVRRATLANGLRVAVRPLRPSDREALRAGHQHLSERSRFRRFLSGKPELTPRDLDILVDGVDFDRHIAVALVWPRTSCDDVLLGVARAIRLTNCSQTADVAVTVADELHGSGGGTLLIRTLAGLAAEHGITRFTAVLLSSNPASARLLTGLGPVTHDQSATGMRELTVQLTAAQGMAA
jgi:hypothetical protein